MPRPLRVQLAGGIYHVVSRGTRRQAIFRDDRDGEVFLALLAEVRARFRWRCRGYCLMPNHYHLIVETPEPNISRGMHRLNFRYAQWFNERYELTGHLFEARFYSGLVESEWHVYELSRYLALNPVRAGLASDPGSWRLSSYAATVGLARQPALLDLSWLTTFGTDLRAARRAFAELVGGE